MGLSKRLEAGQGGPDDPSKYQQMISKLSKLSDFEVLGPGSIMRTEQPQTTHVDITTAPQTPWVFKTLSMGGWDYEGNPILVVATLELVKDSSTGKLQGSNVIFDFVDPKKPSSRVAVMTDSLLEVLDEIKGAYTMERLASEGKK